MSFSVSMVLTSLVSFVTTPQCAQLMTFEWLQFSVIFDEGGSPPLCIKIIETQKREQIIINIQMFTIMSAILFPELRILCLRISSIQAVVVKSYGELCLALVATCYKFRVSNNLSTYTIHIQTTFTQLRNTSTLVN